VTQITVDMTTEDDEIEVVVDEASYGRDFCIQLPDQVELLLSFNQIFALYGALRPWCEDPEHAR
jgi:hypothetical protein